jgi:hypothetical protein
MEKALPPPAIVIFLILPPVPSKTFPEDFNKTSSEASNPEI